MEQSEIDNLARTWIAKTGQMIKAHNAPPDIKNIPAHPLDEMVYGDPEAAWLVIDAARRMTKDELMLANIAAGPLENLLAKHGEQFIERFEDLAQKDKDFAFLMAGVWVREDMSPSVAARIKDISRKR